MNDTRQILRPSLAIEVAAALRDMILEGELKPGEKVREKELTERFGISRTPLREAMKMLASEGLIALIPNRGAMISDVSDSDLAHAFPVLAVLEGLAGAEAAQHASAAALAEISAMTKRLRMAFERQDRPGYFKINQSIHAAILAASGNPTLARTHAAVAGQVHRARYQANLSHARWSEAVREHEAIAKALEQRAAETVRDLLSAHMHAKLASVVEARRAASPD